METIKHGVIHTRDHRYVKILEVVPVNFLLRSAQEQRSIIYGPPRPGPASVGCGES